MPTPSFRFYRPYGGYGHKPAPKTSTHHQESTDHYTASHLNPYSPASPMWWFWWRSYNGQPTNGTVSEAQLASDGEPTGGWQPVVQTRDVFLGFGLVMVVFAWFFVRSLNKAATASRGGGRGLIAPSRLNDAT